MLSSQLAKRMLHSSGIFKGAVREQVKFFKERNEELQAQALDILGKALSDTVMQVEAIKKMSVVALCQVKGRCLRPPRRWVLTRSVR